MGYVIQPGDFVKRIEVQMVLNHLKLISFSNCWFSIFCSHSSFNLKPLFILFLLVFSNLFISHIFSWISVDHPSDIIYLSLFISWGGGILLPIHLPFFLLISLLSLSSMSHKKVRAIYIFSPNPFQNLPACA